MPAYLKIENIGVCLPEGFIDLGVSLADSSHKRGAMWDISGVVVKTKRGWRLLEVWNVTP